MTALKTWTNKLSNVPHLAADFGLNFLIAVIATISGLGVLRRGRFATS